MVQSKKVALPNGLPARFTGGKDGFKRLCDFLEIRNRQHKQRILAIIGKKAIKGVAHGLSTAERELKGITAFYETPESRRTRWQHTREPSQSDAGDPGQVVPSFENCALQRYNASILDREVDKEELKNLLSKFPDVIGSIDDVPKWQFPALAAWIDLHRDITKWEELSKDRRDNAVLALFAVATILDDVRFLQWAAESVDMFAGEFAEMLEIQRPDEPPDPDNDDVIKECKKICNEIAAAADRLSGDLPRLRHWEGLRQHMCALENLHDSLVRISESTEPKKLLQKLQKELQTLVEKHDDSPVGAFIDQIYAQWQQSYPVDGEPDARKLRDDVERAVQETRHALEDWHTARKKRTNLQAQLEENRRQKDEAKKPTDVFALEDLEGELVSELATASRRFRTARDRIFVTVAPGEEKFEPTKDYLPHPPPSDYPTGEPSNGKEDGSSGASGEESKGHGDEGGKDRKAATTSGDDAPTEPESSEPFPEKLGGGDVSGPQEISVITALWRALEYDRPGIAYQIAKLIATKDRQELTVPSADVIAAATLAPHVASPDSNVAHEIGSIMERIDPDKLLQNNWEDHDRDAISLLLLSAGLRPALFAPLTGAASLLRRISLSEDLAPVYELTKTLVKHTDRSQGIHLDIVTLRATLNDTWQREFDALAASAREWHAKAKSKRNLYAPANRVWQDLLSGCLADLVSSISYDDTNQRERVDKIYKQINSKKAFKSLVQQTDRNSRKGEIEGRAFKQIWNDVQPAVEMSEEWMNLMVAKPGPDSFIGEKITALYASLNNRGPGAIAALKKAISHEESSARTAALKCAHRAVDDLLQLFGDEDQIKIPDQKPNVILSRDLLYVTSVKLDMKLNPVLENAGDLLDILVAGNNHAENPRIAFEARLRREDFIGARLILDFFEEDFEKDDVLDKFCNSLAQQLDTFRGRLRVELSAEEENLENAFCCGQIDSDKRNDTAVILSSLRAVAMHQSLILPSLEEVDAVANALPSLGKINAEIQKSCRASIKRAQDRLRELPVAKLPKGVKSAVERVIDAGDILTANELIERLGRGESVEQAPLATDPFLKFMETVETIEREREKTTRAAIMSCAANRKAIAGVHFEELSSDDEVAQATGLLEAWYTLAQAKAGRINEGALQDLLQGLGFKVLSVVTKKPGRGWPLADVTTEPIEDRALCPSRQFGSEAEGRYRVLLNWDRPADESISRSIGSAVGRPTMVLHFGCLGADREKLRAQAIQTRRQFLVIDESLILFLAGGSVRRLSTLFRCTLPFSSARPYTTTSGLVPPELFYGRERERQAVMDQSGACFIYGGRQLGKTALLRRVERDFNTTDETHRAKWIDLKVNEIGYARGAHEIWPLLQRELQPLKVIDIRRELDPEHRRQVESFLGQIQKWLDERVGRRLILLLDEADEFLVQDAKTDFRESARLKGLMDRTERRFKVVFAGLHNVLRTTQQANHPLAHFGDPICVGAMLSNGEWNQAQALVEEPLRAVGCRFKAGTLSTRILGQTNYYPSLIQLYGTELVERLRDSMKPFPYEIDNDDINRAYDSQGLQGKIRERFALTLGLDQRYEVVAYALAFELSEGISLGKGMERSEIMEMARGWWPEGFELQDVEFNMLLHEMEGLGVLREIQPRRYTFRNPNILLFLGGRKNIEDVLDKERTRPAPFEPASFRARYPNDLPSSSRRGPLTYQQETKLRNGGVAVICGCISAGLNDVAEFVSKRIGSESFLKLGIAGNVAEFERQLKRLRPARNNVTVYLVPQETRWDVSWLVAAKRILKNRAQGRRIWSKVAFIASPADLWRLLSDADALDLEDVDWIGPGPCDETFLRRWLQDTNLATADDAGSLFRISGGWMTFLESFSKKRPGKSWQARIGELERETLKDPIALMRKEFGLSDGAEIVFRGLIEADDPFDHDSIELVSSEVGLGQEEVQCRVDWGELLGLLVREGKRTWTFNPLVKRLLEATAPE